MAVGLTSQPKSLIDFLWNLWMRSVRHVCSIIPFYLTLTRSSCVSAVLYEGRNTRLQNFEYRA